ncbi:MAG: hypothetical protein AB2811_00330, partial [Candidatus Sedimenticola endophacoides]
AGHPSSWPVPPRWERGIRQICAVFDRHLQSRPAIRGGSVLLKADADIILQGVMDTADGGRRGRQRFYQCCGVAMARYIADPRMDKQGNIERVYQQIHDRLENIPRVEMVLLPVSHLRFAYWKKENLDLHNSIIGLNHRLERLKWNKGKEIRAAGSKSERNEIIEKYQGCFFAVKAERQKLIDHLIRETFSPFYISRGPARMTQYDLRELGQPLQIPDEVFDMSLKSHGNRLRRLLVAYPDLASNIFH